MSASPSIPFPNSGGPRHPSPEDLVLFAMELFSAEESARIARHLESCLDCREELGRIYGDLALTAATVDLEAPSSAARQRLLQQVTREKKVIPMGPQRTPQQAAQPSPRLAAEPTPLFTTFGRSGSVLSIDTPPERQTGRTVLAVAGWAVAAMLAVGVFVEHKDRSSMHTSLAFQAAQLQRLNTDAASAHQLLDALTDPKAVRVTLTALPLPKAQPIGGVTYNPNKGSLVFLASNMDPLETLKTYELWVIPADGTAPLAAGTFHPDDQGNASVIMPDLPKGVAAKGFGITVENDGGAQVPTLPIIMSGS